MSTEVLSKTKKKIEMVTIPKSEYEELKKNSEELKERKERKFHGPTMAREVIKSLKNGEKPVRIR